MKLLSVMNKPSNSIQTKKQLQDPYMKSLKSKFNSEITMKLSIHSHELNILISILNHFKNSKHSQMVSPV
jgi:hypothetical protein